MRLRSTCFTAAAVIAALLLGSRAWASMVLAMDLGELAKRAETIVVAEVLSVQSGWERGQRTVVSRIDVQVAERWKGSAARRLTIVQVGGEANGVVVKVHGGAQFAVGERAVLFLTGPDTAATVVGMGQGKRPLRFDANRGRWLVGAGDTSAAVRPDGKGGLAPAPGDEKERPLEDVRARVRAALRAK